MNATGDNTASHHSRRIEKHKLMILSIAIGTTIVLLTMYGIYVAFGPPSKQLIDSFDEHED